MKYPCHSVLTRLKAFRYKLNSLLAIAVSTIAMLLGACSGDSGEETQPVVEPPAGPFKFTLNIVSPELQSTILANASDGSEVDTRFYSHFNDGARENLLARQGDRIINLGSFDVTPLSTSGDVGRIEVDATGQLNAGQSFDLYVLGCSGRWDENGVYYRTLLTRDGSFGTWLKVSSSSLNERVNSQIAGTGEILFVINKSDAPIRFRHKGFDVTERWYYTQAEVSIDDGRIVTSENGNEVVSDENSVPVFTGQNAQAIYSTYVPSGKSIADAQLIAEINGVEVRSVNRISSDIVPQTGQSYAMFAVWDGQQLTMGDDENGQPVVHVCSGENSEDIQVIDVRDDGTIILSSSSSVKPQVGEIMVSGVTEVAPYGYLRKVESISEQGGQIVVRTSQASLNEVLPDCNAEVRLPLGEALPDESRTRADHDFDLLDFDREFNIFGKPGGVDQYGKERKESHITGNVKIGAKMGGTFLYESSWGIPQRIGIKLDGSLSVKVVIEAALKADWKNKMGDINLAPITVFIMGVPVCVRPAIQFNYAIKPKGKLYAKWKVLDIDAWKFDAHLIWNLEEDADGKNWDRGASSSSDLTQKKWYEYFTDMLNMEVGMSGEVVFAVWPEVRFKLYDQDNISLGIGISPYAKLSGELALQYQYDEGSWDDFELKDNISLAAGVNIPVNGKLEFKLPSWTPDWIMNRSFVHDGKIGGEVEDDIQILEVPIISGATLFPVFNSFNIYPEENVLTRDKVHVSSIRDHVALTVFGEFENDFGYCIALTKRNDDSLGGDGGSNGEGPGGGGGGSWSRTHSDVFTASGAGGGGGSAWGEKEWRFISLRDRYGGVGYRGAMELDIPTSELEPNATYEVRPYTEINVIGTKRVKIKRKGGKFTTGGSLEDGTGVIIDVPGEKF